MGMKTKDEEKSKREFRNCAIAQNLNKVECFAPFMAANGERIPKRKRRKSRLLFEPVSFAYSVFDYCIRTFHAAGELNVTGHQQQSQEPWSTTAQVIIIQNQEEKNVCIKNDISRLLIYQKTFKRTNEPKDKKNARSYKAATTTITAQSICILNHLTPRVCCYLNQNILGVVFAVVCVIFSPVFLSLTVCIWTVFSMPFRFRVFHALSLSMFAACWSNMTIFLALYLMIRKASSSINKCVQSFEKT